MSFGQALSGLNAASQNLNVIGNNIANANTVGFKSGSASFADVYANSRVGMGVQVAGIHQRFTTGSLEVTGNQYDMAIDGEKGFFRLLADNGDVLYSRNGQFMKDKDNFIVNAQGNRLTGYPPDTVLPDGTRVSGVGKDPVPLSVPVTNIAPRATNTLGLVRNLDSRSEVIAASTTFDQNNAATYSNAVPMTVYDSLGNAHTLTQYFTKREPDAATGESVWEVNFTFDNDVIGTPGEMRFDSAGRLSSGAAGTITVQNIVVDGSPADDLVMDFDYTGTTQFGTSYTQNFIQNGYPSGEFVGISVDPSGRVQAAYTNGEYANIGTLALANFNNVNGLNPVGGNSWQESPDSGPAALGQPGTNGLSSVKGQAIEASNVDMSAELVNMIVAQRTYQANAQTIKTQDQIMQTLISMR